MAESTDGDWLVTGRLLRAIDATAPFEILDVVRAELARELPVAGVDLLFADYSATTFQRLGGSETGDAGDITPIDDSALGRAFRHSRVEVSRAGVQSVVHVPVCAQGERLAVLEVIVAGEVASERLRYLTEIGLAVAYAISVSERHTDLFSKVRRQRKLELAAEIQWQLLPALTEVGPSFSLAGWLEPAYEVGGDNFDFASDPDLLTVTVTDGVGHGVRSSLLTCLAVSSLRNERREGGGITSQAEAANRALADHDARDMFVTGVLMEVHTDTGKGTIVNAGHPKGRLVRDGRIELLDTPPDLPLGLYGDFAYRGHPIELRPDDRLIFLSDGVLEATDGLGGDAFGTAKLDELILLLADSPPAEVVRSVTNAVGELQKGRLRDDATVVCLDWRGGRGL